MKALRDSIIIALAMLLSACGGNLMMKADSNPATNTLVFGYIDMDEAPAELDWFSIRQVLPKTDKPFWSLATDNGMYYNSFFVEGAYQIDSFGGYSGWRKTNYTFSFPRQNADIGRFKIAKPGLHFLGSYKFKKVKTGFFDPDKFDVELINSPSERELLERLLKTAESKPWQDRIRKRIQELSK